MKRHPRNRRHDPDYNLFMRYSLLIEPVHEAGFPTGYYYAHVPAFDLTTHGEGIEGARAAAKDLILLWVEEKRACGEPVPRETCPRVRFGKS